jgi:hypothetical protein
MMAVTIKQVEELPESYPDLGSPSPLSEAAQAFDSAFIWQRLEAYVAHRWTPRDVTWIVEGMGEWTPPLSPAAIEMVHVWRDGWEIAEVPNSPMGGLYLTGHGQYRIVAEVGGGSPAPALPEAVREAFRRVAEYMAAKPGKPGASREALTVGSISLVHSRDPAFMAKALQNSGAADLLRSFRRC